MRTMYDSTTAADIPADAEIVAGYLNGAYEWSDADWALFPDAIHVGIVIHIPGQTPPPIGDVLDIEASDAPNAYSIAEAWVNARRAAGADPVIYTSRSTAGYFSGLQCGFWLADYTGAEHMADGNGMKVVATQWASPDYGRGGHYDLSLVVDSWPSAVKEKPMYDPPIVVEPIVADLACPDGGAWTLAASGAINAWGGAPYEGGANGTPFFAGRTAAKLVPPDPTLGEHGKYTIVATSRERYTFPYKPR